MFHLDLFLSPQTSELSSSANHSEILTWPFSLVSSPLAFRSLKPLSQNRVWFLCCGQSLAKVLTHLMFINVTEVLTYRLSVVLEFRLLFINMLPTLFCRPLNRSPIMHLNIQIWEIWAFYDCLFFICQNLLQHPRYLLLFIIIIIIVIIIIIIITTTTIIIIIM
jgi:hypothetical protein